MAAQTIAYPCCGGVFAACAVPECYKDRDWQKELRGYTEKGMQIEVKESGEYRFTGCTCKKSDLEYEAPVENEDQLKIF